MSTPRRSSAVGTAASRHSTVIAPRGEQCVLAVIRADILTKYYRKRCYYETQLKQLLKTLFLESVYMT